jgi:hypothetical protein
MLSEGYSLRRSLEEAGFNVPAKHPKILSPGKTPGYRVGITEDGSPATVDELNAEEIASLWYHIEGKQNAFPVVKVQHALLAVPKKDSLRQRLNDLNKSQEASRVLLLREAMNSHELRLPPTDEQAWTRLRSKAETFRRVFTEEEVGF